MPSVVHTRCSSFAYSPDSLSSFAAASQSAPEDKTVKNVTTANTRTKLIPYKLLAPRKSRERYESFGSFPVLSESSN